MCVRCSNSRTRTDYRVTIRRPTTVAPIATINSELAGRAAPHVSVRRVHRRAAELLVALLHAALCLHPRAAQLKRMARQRIQLLDGDGARLRHLQGVSKQKRSLVALGRKMQESSEQGSGIGSGTTAVVV